MIKLSVYKMTTLDNFKHGCGVESNDHGCIHTQKFNDFESAKRYLMAIDRTTPLSILDDHLVSSTHENDDGNTPMTKQLNEWRDGKRDLWLCDYSYYLTIVTEQELSESDITNHFPELKQA